MTIKFDKSKLVKNLAAGKILVPYLERAFNDFDDPWTFEYTTKLTDNAWHPSGDCTPSVTSLYEKAMGRERDSISGSLRKSFMVGHYWHQLLQHIILYKLGFCDADAIEKRGTKWWGQVEPVLIDPASPRGLHDFVKAFSGRQPYATPQPYHWVTGQGDIAPLKTSKWQGIVDIKTMSSHQFKAGTLPAWAVDKYTCQINIYMDLFDEEKGLILAVNKDAPHDFREFPFERNQKLIDAIYEKWSYVSACLTDGTTPSEEDNERYALPV